MFHTKKPLIFVDLETTGTTPGKHEIIEIGAVRAAPEPPYAIEAEFEVKVEPQRLFDADPEALKVNRFNEGEWRGALPEAEAVRQFIEFAAGGRIWGWNVSFERVFLEPAINRAGFTADRLNIDYVWFDLKVLFMLWAKLQGREKELGPRFGLSTARPLFKITDTGAHRALPDARATYEVFVKLAQEFAAMAQQQHGEGQEQLSL